MKNLGLIILLACTSIIAQAQPNWLMKGGSAGNDEALAICTDAQGNLFTTGYFTQPALFGIHGIVPTGSGDVFVAKQNNAGVYQWAVKAGGVGSDRGLGICTDAQGNTYITGFYSGQAQFGPFTLNSNAFSQDIFVAKLNGSGVFQWAVSFGGTNIDLPSGIAIDAQSNLILTGQFKGTGVFGLNQFTSVVDPSTNESSYDIFILKLDNAGAVQWAKHGKSKRDDRGLQAATDPAGNIYLTGQYSDTLKFTNTYNNVAYNVCYLMKLLPNGQEVWFKRLQASMTAITGLVCKNNNLYVAGDFLGQLVLTGPPSITLSSAYSKKIFVAKYDMAGTPLWVKTAGSENPLAARALAVDDNGNSYVTGNFKCNLTEFSALYGIGVFNSVGFRDIFVAKFDGNGQRQWERQLGGTGDDYAAAMVINAVDKPIICGSFEKYFNAPSSSSFTTYPQNTDIANYGPNYFSSACGDGNYGDFVSVSSTGNKDVLSMMAIDLSRQPYDYYTRNGNCVRDTLMPFINQGQDTIKACGQVLLSPTLRTGADGYIGPEYEYLWSTGSTTDTIWAISTGQYILNYNYKDECRVFSDTIYVIIYPNPPGVDITSPYGPVIRATPILDCENKLLVEVGDTAILQGPQPPPGLISYWTQPNGQIVNNQNTLPAWQAGTYTYTVATPNGLCSSTNCVEVILFSYDPSDGSGVCLPINFKPNIFFPGFMGSDTLRMCPRDTFTAVFADSSLYMQGLPHTIPVFGQWSNSSNISLYYWPDGSEYTILVHKNVYSGQQTGPASITVNLIPPPGTGPPILTYTHNFYLEIYPEPPNNTTLTGDVSGLCPGDTAQIFVAGGDNYQFNGTIDVVAPDSSWFKVTTPGFYSVYSAVYDAVTGCVNRDTVLIGVDYKPAPMVTMNPFTGLICPNDSVLLTTEAGGSYFWVGPLGDTISVAQTAYATSAGNYFYVMTDGDGCTQVSEFVEIREYSTPFLGADPGTVLCPGGSLTLHVDADPGVIINWGPPFSGSNDQQTVTDTGTYSVSVTFCDITTTLNIVITSPTVEAEISVIGDSLLCSGQTVTLMANAGPYGYDWQPVGESTPDLLVEDEGNYILTVTDENGCTATDSISFSMIASPPPPTSVTGDTVCVGDSAVVYAQGPGTIAWYLSNNSPYLALGNQYTTPPITGQDVLYAGIVDTVTGCHSLLITVDLAVKPAPVAPPVVVDTTICLGNTLTLGFDSLQSNMAYTWQGPGIAPITQNPIVVNNFANGNEGVYYLVVTPVDSTLCGVDTASFNITTVDLPQINLPGDTLLACIGSDILLQTDTAQGVTYTWQWPGGSGTGASVEVINFQPNDEGYYIVTSTNTLEGCSTVDSVFADGIPLPVVQLSTAQLLCVGDSVTITASSLGLPTGSTYIWSGPADFVQGDSSITIVNATTAASGQYTLEITATGCSPTPQTIDIVVNYIDTLAVVTDTVFCAGGALLLQVPAIYATYSWNTGATTPEITVDSAGAYFITVTAANGCTDTVTITVDEVECSFGDLPNVFTPNGDGFNDTFIFDIEGAENITVQIFNRWGNLVRVLDGESVEWDGTNNAGTMVSAGVYYYIGQAKLINGKQLEVAGYIQVLN